MFGNRGVNSGNPMGENDRIQWSTSTNGDRQRLYRALRAVVAVTKLSVEDIIKRAYGADLIVAPTDVESFRKGKIGREKARLMYQWIARHHLKTGQRYAPELFGALHEDAFERLLVAHASTETLTVRVLGERGLIEREDEMEAFDTYLDLGQPFCFHLKSELEGWGAAYQGYGDAWHEMRIGSKGDRIFPVRMGEQLLPCSPSGQPIKLYENQDTGPHRFAVVVVSEDQKPLLRRFAPEVVPPRLEDSARLHMTRVLIG